MPGAGAKELRDFFREQATFRVINRASNQVEILNLRSIRVEQVQMEFRKSNGMLIAQKCPQQ